MQRLSACLRCVKKTPPGRPFWGYIYVKNIQSLLTCWGGIIYAGALTYEALRITDCLPEKDSSCSNNGNNEEDDTPGCRRLWGLITPESLLTVIATAGTIVISLCSSFVGNYVDRTPYRRQIAIGGSLLIACFSFVCAAIISPSENTLMLCSICLFFLTVLKEILIFTVETYAPELSHISSEVSGAITAGNLWFYLTMVGWLLIMAVIGISLSSNIFGSVTSIITGAFVLVFAFGAFSRLPDVPAAQEGPPDGGSIMKASLIQLKALANKTYYEYPDLGLVLLANMVFDPALNAIFTVAIQVLIAAYHFTSQEIPIIFLCAVICSVPGIALSKFITSSALWKHFEPKSVSDVIGAPSIDNAVELIPAGEQVMIDEDFGNGLNVAEEVPLSVLQHPRRILIALCGGLLAVTAVTILAPFILRPCNIGLAILVGCMWSFCMCYNWNCSTMLRAALVPGGSEAEFAGLALVSFNLISWLPLLIFLIMANAGFLIEALWSLCAFFMLGVVILSMVNIDRGVEARNKTMHLRRWVRKSRVEREEICCADASAKM